ncbi:MAG: metal-dependent hydrolase [Candidatus Heimdallarchaeota archaeon]
MDFFTHFLMAIFISIYTLNSLPFSIVLYAIIMAIIADFDIVLEPLQLIKKSNFLSHKGLSHSYFTAIIFSFFTASIFTLITNENFVIVWVVGFLFYSLHISLDLMTASKIPIFYPFSKRRYRFFIDRAINFVLALISGTVIIFYSILYFFFPQLFFSYLFQYFFGFYLLYFMYRIISKIWIQAKLPSNALYIPGLFPFRYFIYEKISSDNLCIFRLRKKIQFSKKNSKIFETQLSNASEDMKYYKKAINIAKNYVFFTKWEAQIPIIKKTDEHCSVILVLAESYFRGSVYGLKVTFNKRSDIIEHVSNGFNLFKINQ